MNLKKGHLLKRGEYRVEKELGQGGFGITYLAEQTGLMRKVAIKEFFMREYCEREHETASITLGSSGSREMVERFRQKFIKEARALAVLNHKHIVRIIDIFEENNTAYYVMEYVDGGSLSYKVKSGALPEADALRYICQVATALNFVHGKRMMHLDVKPSNILLNENDEAVLIDFGLAKQYDTQGSQTSTTPVGISHGYAPLEQYRQGGVGTFSPATDIYSLGATLYKLLTGETPPEAGDVMNEGLPELPVGISSNVRKAIETAMQPAVRKRPQSVGEFLSLLEGNVKAESGKVKVAGKREQSTSSLDALPSDSGLREAKAEPMVATNQSGKPDDGATEILHSVQDDKYRENSSSANLGEVPQAEGYNPNRASVISNESEKSPENGENEILHSAQNDKEHVEEDNSNRMLAFSTEHSDGEISSTDDGETFLNVVNINECEENIQNENANSVGEVEEHNDQKPAENKSGRSLKEELFMIVFLAAICILLAFYGLKSCSDHKAAGRSHSTINGPEYVDLGLSVKWATCNVGASSPGDYGRHYAWGETTTKSDYTEANSTTYGKQMTGIADNSTYDVARREWGGTWRLPTQKEFQELLDNCTWTWTTQNGHDGYKVTSKKNGNSIFLPAAGLRDGTSLYNQGTNGYYWSATSDESNTIGAFGLGFDYASRDVSWGERYYGISVRPVCE